MNIPARIPALEHRSHGFAIGLLTGAFAGAGLAIWLAPLIPGLRRRVADSAKNLRNQASERYQQATTRVVETGRGAAIDLRI
jgi:hypothetical protein